jgi:PhnB protein
MAKAAKPIPEGYYSVTPTLTLDNAADTIEWYKRALNAQEISRSLGPDGKVMHAEILIGNSKIMVNDAVMGMKGGPKAYGGSPAGLWLFVDNSDAAFDQAVREGAQVVMPVADQFWGDRGGCVVDPAGYQWWIATRKEDLTREEMNQRAEVFFKEMAKGAAAGAH